MPSFNLSLSLSVPLCPSLTVALSFRPHHKSRLRRAASECKQPATTVAPAGPSPLALLGPGAGVLIKGNGQKGNGHW